MTSFGKWAPLKLIIGFSIAKIDNYRADWQNLRQNPGNYNQFFVPRSKYLKYFLGKATGAYGPRLDELMEMPLSEIVALKPELHTPREITLKPDGKYQKVVEWVFWDDRFITSSTKNARRYQPPWRRPVWQNSSWLARFFSLAKPTCLARPNSGSSDE